MWGECGCESRRSKSLKKAPTSSSRGGKQGSVSQGGRVHAFAAHLSSTWSRGPHQSSGHHGLQGGRETAGSWKARLWVLSACVLRFCGCSLESMVTARVHLVEWDERTLWVRLASGLTLAPSRQHWPAERETHHLAQSVLLRGLGPPVVTAVPSADIRPFWWVQVQLQGAGRHGPPGPEVGLAAPGQQATWGVSGPSMLSLRVMWSHRAPFPS